MGQLNDLRLLSVFVAVYRQRGISSAARVLNVSQPSVTRSIRSLESELGAELFSRTSSGMVPTELGARVYRRALSIIDEVDSLHADAAQLGEADRRLLRIGSGYGCWASVGDKVTSFSKLHDDVVFNITVASGRALVAESERGALDAIVANREMLETATWLITEPWRSLEWYFFARRNHPVFREPPEQQNLAIRKYRFATYHMLENAHGTAMSGSASLRANDHLLLYRAVAESDCYVMVSEDMLGYAVDLGLRKVGDQHIDVTEYAIAYPRDVVAPDTAAFVEHVRHRAGPTTG